MLGGGVLPLPLQREATAGEQATRGAETRDTAGKGRGAAQLGARSSRRAAVTAEMLLRAAAAFARGRREGNCLEQPGR